MTGGIYLYSYRGIWHVFCVYSTHSVNLRVWLIAVGLLTVDRFSDRLNFCESEFLFNELFLGILSLIDLASEPVV